MSYPMSSPHHSQKKRRAEAMFSPVLSPPHVPPQSRIMQTTAPVRVANNTPTSTAGSIGSFSATLPSIHTPYNASSIFGPSPLYGTPAATTPAAVYVLAPSNVHQEPPEDMELDGDDKLLDALAESFVPTEGTVYDVRNPHDTIPLLFRTLPSSYSDIQVQSQDKLEEIEKRLASKKETEESNKKEQENAYEEKCRLEDEVADAKAIFETKKKELEKAKSRLNRATNQKNECEREITELSVQREEEKDMIRLTEAFSREANRHRRWMARATVDMNLLRQILWTFFVLNGTREQLEDDEFSCRRLLMILRICRIFGLDHNKGWREQWTNPPHSLFLRHMPTIPGIPYNTSAKKPKLVEQVGDVLMMPLRDQDILKKPVSASTSASTSTATTQGNSASTTTSTSGQDNSSDQHEDMYSRCSLKDLETMLNIYRKSGIPTTDIEYSIALRKKNSSDRP